MSDKEYKTYKVRHIRMDDEVWEELKEKRRRSKSSWNQFIKSLIKENNE
jgi:hypothetical protein